MKSYFVKRASTVVVAVVCSVLVTSAEESRGASSQEELAKQVVAALVTKDRKALESFAITQAEFKQYIWPGIAGHVGNGGQMSAEKFYTMSLKSSQAGLAESLGTLSGKEWQLVKIASGAEKRQGKDFRLLDAPLVTVRAQSGQEKTIQPIGEYLSGEAPTR